MKRSSRSLSIVLSIILIIGFIACGGSLAASSSSTPDAPANVTYLKFGHSNSTDGPQQKVAEIFDSVLAEKLPHYRLEIYPSSQLGNERDVIEAVQMGTVDLYITATTPLANAVPSLMAFELLYLIKDYEHAYAVFQGEIGQRLIDEISAHNMKALGFTDNGFRHLVTNKSVETLSDIKGLKLRVMENPLTVECWNELGTNTITMNFTDALTGIQQKTIDALEVPWSLITAQGIYDSASYVAETSHIYDKQVIIMSNKAWNSFSTDDQAIFQECAVEALRMAREYSRKMNEGDWKQIALDRGGMKVTNPDLTEWREKMQSVYANYEGEYGEIIREILALAK